VTAALHQQIPDLGTTVAIDASDMPAYGNGLPLQGRPGAQDLLRPRRHLGAPLGGQHPLGRELLRYKLHQLVCVVTGLPLAWRVETAKVSESSFAIPLLEAVIGRRFRPEIAVMDMGYDHEGIYVGFEAHDCHPVIPLRQTPAVKAGKHKPPTCEHGEWTFAGSDAKAAGGQVALPNGCVLPGQPVDRGQPTAHPHPPVLPPVEEALPPARRGRAGEWPTQARVGLAAPAGSANRAGAAPRRPCDPRPADGGARQGASRAAGRVGGPAPKHHPPRGSGLPEGARSPMLRADPGRSVGEPAHAP